jgi:hypothetical protein
MHLDNNLIFLVIRLFFFYYFDFDFNQKKYEQDKMKD